MNFKRANIMKTIKLKELDKADLIKLIQELSKLNKKNKAYIESKLASDFDNLLEISYKNINKAFSCFELMSLKDARQTITDFKKSKPHPDVLIKLYLHYLKSAQDLEKSDWRFQEYFYLAVEKIFKELIQEIKKSEEFKIKYEEEIQKIIRNANEGWAHKETLEEIYEELLETK